MTVSSVSRSIKLVQFVLIILISIVTVWANIYLFNFTLQQDEYEHTSLVPYLVNFVFLLVTISVTYWYIGSVIVEDVINIIHTTSNVLFFAILLLCSQGNLKTIRLEMAFSITYIVLSTTLILLICLKSKNRSLLTNSSINHNDGDFVIPIGCLLKTRKPEKPKKSGFRFLTFLKQKIKTWRPKKFLKKVLAVIVFSESENFKRKIPIF